MSNYTIGGTWTFSNDTTLASSKKLILTDNTTNTLGIKATNSTTSWTLSLPTTAGLNTQVLTTDGSGNTSWVSQSGSGTVNAGTATHLSYYATSSNVISDANGASINGSYTFTGGAGAITMSGSTIAMGTNKITGLAAGTANGDALRYEQILNAAGFIKGSIITTSFGQFSAQQTASLNTSTYTNIGSGQAITLKANTSIVKVTIGGTMSINANSATVTIRRGTTDISAGSGFINTFDSNGNIDQYITMSYYDSPATTGSVTYNLAAKATSGTPSFFANNATFFVLEELAQ